MTLPLHYWLVSSGEFFIFLFLLLCPVAVPSLDGHWGSANDWKLEVWLFSGSFVIFSWARGVVGDGEEEIV